MLALSLANYYRRFIKGYSNIVSPLTDYITHVGAKFLNNGGRFKFKHLVGSDTCWEESPMLAIDTKVYTRDVGSNLEGVRECAIILYFCKLLYFEKCITLDIFVQYKLGLFPVYTKSLIRCF